MASNVAETYRHKWMLEAEDRTKAAFATATQNARGLDRQLANIMRTAGPGGILGAIGMGAAAGLINREIRETADEFDSLAKRARSLGLASEELDALEFAAEKSGVAANQLGVAMKTLMRQMSDAARGTGEGRIAFEAMGISVTDSNGRLKSATQVMAEVADGAQNLATAEDRAAMMQKLFGESGVGMVNMLNEGAAGFRALVGEGYALGARYDEMTIRGEAYKDAQLRLNRALRSTKDAVVSQALPGLTLLAEAISGHVMRAVTGLDEEFRTFLGTLRTMPAEMALSEMEAKERELLAAVEATNAELRERQRAAEMARGAAGAGANVRYVPPETHELFRAGAAANDARTKLAALREEMGRLREQTASAAKVEEFYRQRVAALGDATGETATETNALTQARGKLTTETTRLSEAEREAAAIIESLKSPQEKMADRFARLYQLMQTGHLTLWQFTRAVGQLREEFDDTSDAVDAFDFTFDELEQEAERSLSAIQTAGVAAAGAIGNGFSDMIRGQMSTIEDFERFAIDSFQRIADALFQSLVVDRLVAGITAGVSGSAPVPAGMQGPTPSGAPLGAAKAAGPVGVSFTINALDTAGAVQILRQNEGLIIGMVQKAYNRAGRRGPNG